MPFQKPFFDANTGASFGNALWVVGEINLDTRQHKASILMSVYVGVAEYSAGRQALTTATVLSYDVVGGAYTNGVDLPLRARAQTYIGGLPEFSGATVI